MTSPPALASFEAEVTACRACPRLVQWRETVAREKRAAFRDWTYWGRPIPGFGDPAARVLILGLAPAAHGANRTGRVFTGDRSGDFLFAGLHRAGYANQPVSIITIVRAAVRATLDWRAVHLADCSRCIWDSRIRRFSASWHSCRRRSGGMIAGLCDN